MSRTSGSWTVQVEAISVRQFAGDLGCQSPAADAAVERLVACGELYRTDDREMCYTYLTQFPLVVLRQWRLLRASDTEPG